MSEQASNKAKTEGVSVTVALPDLRRQLIALHSRYERADDYNRAALEPLIRKALARAEEAET